MTPELSILMNGVKSLPCETSRRMMLRTLRVMAGSRVFLPLRELAPPGEVDIAVSMLDAHMLRRDARDALMQRLQCGRTRAYKLLRLAMDARRGRLGGVRVGQ